MKSNFRSAGTHVHYLSLFYPDLFFFLNFGFHGLSVILFSNFKRGKMQNIPDELKDGRIIPAFAKSPTAKH